MIPEAIRDQGKAGAGSLPHHPAFPTFLEETPPLRVRP